MKTFSIFINILAFSIGLQPAFARIAVTHEDTGYLDDAATTAQRAFPKLSEGPVPLSKLNEEIKALEYFRQKIILRLQEEIFRFCSELEGEEAAINKSVAINSRALGPSKEESLRLEKIGDLRLYCLTAKAAEMEGLKRRPKYWYIYADLDAEAERKLDAWRVRRGNCMIGVEPLCE